MFSLQINNGRITSTSVNSHWSDKEYIVVFYSVSITPTQLGASSCSLTTLTKSSQSIVGQNLVTQPTFDYALFEEQ